MNRISNQPVITLQPEARFLLVCLSRNTHEERAQQINTIATQIQDWKLAFSQAERHGVVALIHQKIKHTSTESIPEEIRHTLQQRLRQISQKNLLMTSELLRILRLFNQQAIRAVPYKGPPLAIQIYGDVSLRQYGDLDILIHRQDFLRARSIMIEQGYQPVATHTSPQEVELYLDNHHDYRFVSQHHPMAVDLQWRIIQRPFVFPPDIEAWWERLENINIGGQTVPALAVDDLLLILCVHGAKHLWERLIWVCDIAELIHRYPDLDWERLLAKARQLGINRMLLLGLLLAQQLLDTKLPAIVLRQILADRQVRMLAALANEHLFRTGPVPPDVLAKMPLYQFYMLERFGDRAQVIWRHLPSLLNPLRILKTYGLTPIKHLLGLQTKQ